MRPIEELQRQVAPMEVISEFTPSGDQPTAIAELERRVNAGEQDVVLLGATGTGKTATVAWLAERLQRPILVMQPNKTLAAQFANELRDLMPNNAIEYFVVLRLLPAGGLPSPDRHLHREGLLTQRRGGTAPAQRDQLVADPA